MKDIKVFFNEFKDFISKGNVLNLAVGVIIGAAFGKIVSSLVADILMPLIGLLMGKVKFSNLFLALDLNTYETVELAKKANIPLLMYGNFIQSIIDFVIVGFSIFIIVKIATKAQESIEKKEEVSPVTKDCPACCSKIHINAKICPFCQTNQ